MRNLEFLFVPYCAIGCKKKQTCNQNNSSCSINAQERRNESLPQVRITKDAKAEQAREGGSADRELNPGTRVAFVDRSSLAPVGASASGGHGFCVISPRHAPKCPAGAEFHSDPFSTFRRGQDSTLMRSPLVGDGRISQRCLLRVSTVAKYLPRAFPGTHPWQDFRLMYDKRGLGRKNTPSVATYRRYASKMSWPWQDLRAAYLKSPANCCLGIHIVKILPGRTPFSVQDL